MGSAVRLFQSGPVAVPGCRINRRSRLRPCGPASCRPVHV